MGGGGRGGGGMQREQGGEHGGGGGGGEGGGDAKGTGWGTWEVGGGDSGIPLLWGPWKANTQVNPVRK